MERSGLETRGYFCSPALRRRRSSWEAGVGGSPFSVRWCQMPGGEPAGEAGPARLVRPCASDLPEPSPYSSSPFLITTHQAVTPNPQMGTPTLVPRPTDGSAASSPLESLPKVLCPAKRGWHPCPGRLAPPGLTRAKETQEPLCGAPRQASSSWPPASRNGGRPPALPPWGQGDSAGHT